MKALRDQGKHGGSTAYGYTIVDGEVEPRAGEIEVVRRTVASRPKKMTVAEIAHTARRTADEGEEHRHKPTRQVERRTGPRYPRTVHDESRAIDSRDGGLMDCHVGPFLNPVTTNRVSSSTCLPHQSCPESDTRDTAYNLGANTGMLDTFQVLGADLQMFSLNVGS